jgi:hypothetical protein
MTPVDRRGGFKGLGCESRSIRSAVVLMTTFAQFMKPNGCRGVPFSPKPDSARRPRFAARLNREGSEVETIALNNGVELPGLGLGVFQTPPGETGGAVRAGLDAGHGILTQAWSPIGGITFYRDGQHGSTVADPVIACIAAVHGKTPARVMLRWGPSVARSRRPRATAERKSPYLRHTY